MKTAEKIKKQKKPREKGALKADLWMLRQIWRYSPSYVWTNVLYGVMMGILPAAGLLYTERLYDGIEGGTAFGKLLLLILVYFGILLVLRGAHTAYQLILLPRYREVINRKLYSDIFAHAAKTDLANYDDPEFFNEFIFSMQGAWPHVIQLIEGTGGLISNAVTMLVGVGVIAGVSPIVAGIILASGVFRILISRRTNALSKKQEEEMTPVRHRRDYIKRVYTTPDYAKELRITRISENLHDDYKEITRKLQKNAVEYGKKYMFYDFLFLLILDFANYAVMLILLWQMLMDPESGVTLGGFAIGVNAIWNLGWRLQDMGRLLMAYHQHGIFVKKIIHFFGIKPAIVGGSVMTEPLQTLCVKNLRFAYPGKDGEHTALQHVDMEIRRGQKIAIVGYNGAGKTTLTKLLMRLYDPTEGQITYNGRDIREYDLDSLRGRVAAVFQDYRIFAATVAENVVGGELAEGEEGKAQRERVIRALTKSTFAGKLATLEKGIDTPLTREFEDDGVQLSGGEAQKVAIARAFYQDADLIILDEPSSALDPNAEYELNRALYDYAEDKTVIFISHRLSTTRHADKIYMFDGGKLIEAGSHEELMAQNGKYAYMFNLQAENYRNGIS
ncbi:MAG: ABC transporter ATP-binding protein [Ruminococcaceae bacterium]|nr:ABC transporter ATP-binding protein [Oscillospiraceae bacterium]